MAREPQWFIMQHAGQAPHRCLPLNSHVRHHEVAMRSASAVATAIALGTRETTYVRNAKGAQSRRCPKETWRFVTLKKTGLRTLGAQRFSSSPSASRRSPAQREASERSQSVEPAAGSAPVPPVCCSTRGGRGQHRRASNQLRAWQEVHSQSLPLCWKSDA